MAKKIIKLGTYRTLVSQLDKLAGTTDRAVSKPRHGTTRPASVLRISGGRVSPSEADQHHWQTSGQLCAVLTGNGLAASTIKTDLAGHRFFHDKRAIPSTNCPPTMNWA